MTHKVPSNSAVQRLGQVRSSRTEKGKEIENRNHYFKINVRFFRITYQSYRRMDIDAWIYRCMDEKEPSLSG